MVNSFMTFDRRLKRSEERGEWLDPCDEGGGVFKAKAVNGVDAERDRATEA